MLLLIILYVYVQSWVDYLKVVVRYWFQITLK